MKWWWITQEITSKFILSQCIYHIANFEDAVFEDFTAASKINSSKSYCTIECYGNLYSRSSKLNSQNLSWRDNLKIFLPRKLPAHSTKMDRKHKHYCNVYNTKFILPKWYLLIKICLQLGYLLQSCSEVSEPLLIIVSWNTDTAKLFKESFLLV